MLLPSIILNRSVTFLILSLVYEAIVFLPSINLN
jgi:hypothetical protein